MGKITVHTREGKVEVNTPTFEKWLSDVPVTQAGGYENNKEWVLSLWSNPNMINHAETIFEAGYKAGVERSKYLMNAAARAIAE